MPTAAPKACLTCGKATPSGENRCPDHARTRTPDNRPSAAHRGYDRKWQKRRARGLMLEPLCRRCKEEGKLTTATVRDHITPKAQGGSDSDSNLQSLCPPCHNRKTATEDGGGWRNNL